MKLKKFIYKSDIIIIALFFIFNENQKIPRIKANLCTRKKCKKTKKIFFCCFIMNEGSTKEKEKKTLSSQLIG
jgi:hypothetical protein